MPENTEINGSVIISGINQGSIEITVKEIMNYNPVTANVTAVDSAGEEVKGSLLSAVLNDFNLSQENLSAIRFVAGDGYQIEVSSDTLKSGNIILAYEKNREPLNENAQPIQIVIPDEGAIYRVRNLTKIEILSDTQSENISRIIFMDTAFKQIPQEDYKYYDNIDKAIKIENLLKNNTTLFFLF